MNDAELIREVQEGDRASLTALYQRYLGGVWRYFHAHLSKNPETTEDLVSETFLVAIRTLLSYDPQKGTFYGWLLGIARNKLRDHFRSTNRGKACFRSKANEADYADSGNPELDLIRVETQDAVIRTLDSLADEEHLVLEWKYMESLSVHDIAVRLERKEKAIESILYRARISFRTTYAREQTQTN
jgi:RNA polymerase sigma-70 factor (ECF subfamily)